MPPIEFRIIAKQALLEKYYSEGWPERLANWPADLYTEQELGYRKILKLWRLPNGDVKCNLNLYPQTGNTVVRQLRDDDDIMWHTP